MKFSLFFIAFLYCAISFAQEVPATVKSVKVPVNREIKIDSVSINPVYFKLTDNRGNVLDSTQFSVDYTRSILTLMPEVITTTDSVSIQYTPYPEFLTRRYSNLDPNIIVNSKGNIARLYSLQESTAQQGSSPFEGLNTNGSITRGVTIGNNQNAVVNSELDLQITGKLSEKVSIRASIQDANIPTQEGGYSQNLDEFDQIFVELYSDNWNIRAGDVNLIQDNTTFGNFTKKIQGISLSGTINHKDGSKTSMGVAGALVRGVFSRSTFTGQEGNQGPYKLVGPNGELFILIVSGSERVYVNGLLLERGENNDYVIDYNAGEIRFNPTYPINSTMRIVIEYQFTDRNYTRFIGYGQGQYQSDTFTIGAFAFSESDAKNQPLQQNLSPEQVAVLQNAGDNRQLMNAPSAAPDTFSENKILYRKELIAGIEAFVFSDNPDDELFNVRFSLVGENNGNYIISNSNTITTIFEFVPPVSGVPQGNYAPIVPLVAPTLLQVGGVHGSYSPNSKTNIDFELSGSRNDLNLFSDVDDNDNQGIAARVAASQTVIRDTLGSEFKVQGSLDFLQDEFQSIERLFNVEFTRDWNLFMPQGDQVYARGGLQGFHHKFGQAQYEFQYLGFGDNFAGNRHVLKTNLQKDKSRLFIDASLLKSSSDSLDANFNRVFINAAQGFKKTWVGAKFNFEDNQQKVVQADSLTPLSQRFIEYQAYAGIGDSTKVYLELGAVFRVTDSVVNQNLERVNTAQSFYAKTKLLNSKNTQLSVFANYRKTDFNQPDVQDEQVLNSRLLYTQRLWENAVLLNTTLESNSGVIPQQEFTYVAVEPGQGIYTWNDYNDNGIQELEEFEVAQFQDEAAFVRVLLPNRVFLKINQNAFSQSITLQPKQWSNSESSFKRILSKFYNQTTYLVDRKIRRDNDKIRLNPFSDQGDDQFGLRLNFKSVLFFNRGLQRYTSSYTYLNTANKNLLATGLQENILSSHQLNFQHKFAGSWVGNLKSVWSENESISQNFPNRNFTLESTSISPKISYLWDQSTRFDASYNFVNKKNTLGVESLEQHKIGLLFNYTKQQAMSITTEFNYIANNFTGSAFSPVAYQLLEGLQPGTNFTWNVLFQKKITEYLDANLSYFGRKSENSQTIHSGSVQLRAFF